MSGGFGQAAYGALPYGSASTQTLVWAWAPFIGDSLRRVDTIEFNVTNEAWVVADLQIRLTLRGGGAETVWSDGGFTESFRRGSVRIPIANGHHYVVRRTGGWPGAVIAIDVQATDLAGTVVSGQAA